MDLISRFQDFLNKSLLIDQTQLINELIKENKLLEYHNKDSFHVALSNGSIAGTETLITDMRTEFEYELSKVNEKLYLSNDDMLIKELKERRDALVDDLDALKNAEGHERPVLQWLLVPYWLSEELIHYGEVVLRYAGSSFWGISCHKGKPLAKEGVLTEIFEELNY